MTDKSTLPRKAPSNAQLWFWGIISLFLLSAGTSMIVSSFFGWLQLRGATYVDLTIYLKLALAGSIMMLVGCGLMWHAHSLEKRQHTES